METVRTVLPIICAYLLGSIPFSLLVARAYGCPDIRECGSGNAGATNVWRVLGGRAATWVFIADIGKGALALLIAMQVDQSLLHRDSYLVICAMAAVAGHCLPFYLNFRGGKGVNTALGAMLMLLPYEALICIVVFAVVVYSSRLVSLGSIIAAVILLPILLFEHLYTTIHIPMPYLISAALIGGIVLFSHRRNILRIIDGTEDRFSFTSRVTKV